MEQQRPGTRRVREGAPGGEVRAPGGTELPLRGQEGRMRTVLCDLLPEGAGPSGDPSWRGGAGGTEGPLPSEGPAQASGSLPEGG